MTGITSFQEFSRRRVTREHNQSTDSKSQSRRSKGRGAPDAPLPSPAEAVTIESQQSLSQSQPYAVEPPGITRLRMSLGQEPEHVLRMVLMRHVPTTEGPRWIGSIPGTDIIDIAQNAASCLVLLNDNCIARGLEPLFGPQHVQHEGSNQP